MSLFSSEPDQTYPPLSVFKTTKSTLVEWSHNESGSSWLYSLILKSEPGSEYMVNSDLVWGAGLDEDGFLSRVKEIRADTPLKLHWEIGSSESKPQVRQLEVGRKTVLPYSGLLEERRRQTPRSIEFLDSLPGYGGLNISATYGRNPPHRRWLFLWGNPILAIYSAGNRPGR